MTFNAEQVGSTTAHVSKSSPEVSLVQRILWILNSLYHQILAILSVLFIWVFFENSDKSSKFFWHMLLSTVAYIPLMAAAIILFSEDNLVTIYIRRTKRYWIHGVLLTASCVAVTIGIAVETYDKNKAKRKHFESNHAILGLVSWILVFVAVATGLVAAKTRTFSSFIRPVVAKLAHNFLGIAGFVIGVGSLYTELHFLQRYTSDHVFNASKWLLWYVTIWSLWAALKSLWSQLKGTFS